MKKIIQIIKNSPLFTGISEENIEAMLSCLSARQVSYPKSSYIISLGDKVSEIGILLSGSLHIIKEDFWGNRNIISEVSIGEVFAESYACSPEEKSSVDVVSNQNSTVIFFDVKKVLTTCSSSCNFHNMLIKNLMYTLAKKNILMTEKITHMTKRNTREKILSFLYTTSLKAGSESFNIPFNRQQLADYLSVDRSALSFTLSKMQEEGILEFNKNHFTLHKKYED